MNKQNLSKLKRSFLKKDIDISGRDEFFNSSVLIPLILIQDEYHLVFQKRNKNISQGGEVCFPGGKFDDKLDKNSLETAIREIYEEFNLKRKK
ncbi:NUDIX domain-containing protein [Clostridium pasteurianum]|uniref:NUDIX domain-containing protein n=1 Tax=Clostridium pasteurianum TaxID=1501 RepID=UPI001FA8F1F7|nr:NUDIX domain-containing protein [Clostridium pasteurianum]